LLNLTSQFARWYQQESATRNYDFVTKLVAFTIFGAIAAVLSTNIANLALNASDLSSATRLSTIAARSATLFDFTLFAALTLLRTSPIARSQSFLARVVALAGTCAVFGFGLLSHPAPSLFCDLLSAALLVLGGYCVCYVVLWLGRSFSIMPEARRLVTTGPYKYVRHPLYTAEAVAALGLLVQYRSLPALLLLIAQWALQVWRMLNEERVLLDTFPDYGNYCAGTPRVIPGLF
jgi:protein-S-isoprenylcysteine O-methyltransferase Ste14